MSRIQRPKASALGERMLRNTLERVITLSVSSCGGGVLRVQQERRRNAKAPVVFVQKCYLQNENMWQSCHKKLTLQTLTGL